MLIKLVAKQLTNGMDYQKHLPLQFFERKSDTTLKEHESKFNFKSDCSPIANQSSSKPIAITQEGTAAADDLNI